MKIYSKKIKKFVKIIHKKNKDKVNNVIGIDINNNFIKSRANLNDVDLNKYKVLKKNQFAFNPMQVGRDETLRVANYKDSKIVIISPAYTVFHITDKEILPEYFEKWLHSIEQQRFHWFKSDSSVRASLDWENFIKMEFIYPELDYQKKICNLGLKISDISQNLNKTYKLIISILNSLVETNAKKGKWNILGNLIEEKINKNIDNEFDEVLGINLKKQFITTYANLFETDLSKYKILEIDCFACNIMHVGRDEALPISLYKSKTRKLISPAYKLFKVKKDKLNEILPEYLMLYFMKENFDKYAWFLSDSSVRGGLDWSRFSELKISYPDIKIQNKIVSIFNLINLNLKFSSNIVKLKNQLNNIFIGRLNALKKI